MDDVQALRDIPGLAARAREAARLLGQHARAIEVLAGIRKDAVIEMHEGGMSHQQIADAIGVSKPRVSQIAGSGWTHTLIARRDKA
jgi:DNA-directed RNA polymerase specialized sigma subunit